MVDTATRPPASVSSEVDQQLEAADDTSAPAAVDVALLGERLLGTWADVRRTARAFVKDPDLHRQDGLTLEQQRERVFGQLKILVERGDIHRAFPKSVGGLEDNGGNITAFEELVLADPSLQIKAGVQWGLFGAAVVHLGT